MKAKKLDELKNKCLRCKKCELGETRNNIVFSDGNPKTARAILIGCLLYTSLLTAPLIHSPNG